MLAGFFKILSGGGSKHRQQQAIQAAQERWADYRRRKNKGNA
jgi:hypothetical protein